MNPSVRNPRLLRKGLFKELYDRYGSRVIYIRSYACPRRDCGATGASALDECPSCNLLSNNFKRVYFDPTIRQITDSLTYTPRPQRLSHRWITSAITVSVGSINYQQGRDFILRGREIVWQGEHHPRAGETYQVAYSAFAEEMVGVTHASTALGQPGAAEEGMVFKPAFIEQGMLGLSIPPESEAYNCDSGDLFVMCDQVETYSGQVDITLPSSRARNRFVISIDKAFYVRKVDGVHTTFDVTNLIGFDFVTQTWDFSGLPANLQLLSLAYTYAPIYTVNMDKGESRNFIMADQPKLVRVVRTEVIW